MTLRPHGRADGAERLRLSETVTLSDAPPVVALDAALAAIGDRDGRATADIVAMQFKYPREVPRN